MTEDINPAARIGKRYLLIIIIGMWWEYNKPQNRNCTFFLHTLLHFAILKHTKYKKVK
tara:strand:+ start:469 stop:642 length:174 start_codon:yes stop_codon:yes gene_type:complete